MTSGENVGCVGTWKNIAVWLQRLKQEYVTRDAFPLAFLLAPVVWLILIDPGSFSLVWFWGRQIGRAGFAFIFFLVAWDWHDSRRKLKATRTHWRQALALIMLGLIMVYYWERVVNSAWTDYLRVYVTSRLGVSQDSPLSFLLAVDFVVYALYFIVIVAILYSPCAASLLITPVIYSLGSGILDMMDAFFPEDSLAFLQVWVYLIWGAVIFILSVLGFHNAVKTPFIPIPPPTILLEGNHLYLWGFKGFITLTIFWPSSGVVSMIVYSLVVVVLMVKLQAPRKRKAAYAIIGALGTYLVNVARITLIVLYVTYMSLDVEAFHESIGETLFICWIFAYLLVVIRIENLLWVRVQRAKRMTSDS